MKFKKEILIGIIGIWDFYFSCGFLFLKVKNSGSQGLFIIANSTTLKDYYG